MRALVKTKAGQGLEMVEKPIPTPGVGEVLIQVRYASICGTDLHIYKWDNWAQGRIKPPLTIGHELSGQVAGLGEGVRNVQEGDWVSAEGHIWCGQCYQCHTGQKHICRQAQIIGVDRDGCFADYVVLPEQNIWKLHPEMDPCLGSVFDPFGNAVHASMSWNLGGRSVLVAGCGPIGVMCVMLAKWFGSYPIIAVETNEYRRGLAKKAGATHVFDPQDVDVAKKALEATAGQGVDIFLEMSGSESAIRSGISAVRPGGGISLLGIPGKEVSLDLAEVIFKQLTVLGINGRRVFDNWYMMEKLVLSGFDLQSLVTHRLPFSEWERGMQLMAEGTCGKVTLEIS
ncbi:MAG: L-threonine 3-dehydrogenase [Limnochordia bacterium]|nr:L-threonine 3-dehydrogenase [Limnochordia bacterium]